MTSKKKKLALLCFVQLSNSQNFNCQKDVPRHPLILKNVAGVWYEIGRVPKTDVFQCLNVTVPDTAESELVLDLEYIRTYDGSRTPVKESLSFPWNINTQNSVFNLLAIVLCGYSTLSPMPLFKLFMRQRELDQKTIDYIQAKLDESIIGADFVWTEQSKCNAAHRRVAGSLSILAFSIFGMLSKCC
ncbi:hypothetical protein ACLKA6_001013 [Drosophila palustris]